MKRIIVTRKQLEEFVEKKKADKVFYSIIENLHKNAKFLNENISEKKANQLIIDDFRRKNLITTRVQELLVKHNIINEKWEII
jgi:hypothetical protein